MLDTSLVSFLKLDDSSLHHSSKVFLLCSAEYKILKVISHVFFRSLTVVSMFQFGAPASLFSISWPNFLPSILLGPVTVLEASTTRYKLINIHLWSENDLWSDTLQFVTLKVSVSISSVISRTLYQPSQFSELKKWEVGALLLLHINLFLLIIKSLSLISELTRQVCLTLVSQYIQRLTFFSIRVPVWQRLG